MLTKVKDKGYEVTVVSWENDGDNYNTLSKTYQSKELAIEIAKLCKTLFISKNNGENGIGNSSDSPGQKIFDRIIDYMKDHLILLDNPNFRGVSKSNVSDQELIDICMEYNNDLLGGSEYYYSRVCESVKITYSPEDIYAEEIKF